MSLQRILLVICIGVVLSACSDSRDQVVVVYTSQDQLYSSKVLAAFSRETGIKVLPLYDSESVKTAGLVNRLVAERQRPRCDVFWSNEELMVHRLAQKGIVREEDISTFGYRSRRLVVNTNLVTEAEFPTSLSELTSSEWRGRIAMAYPLYGTTITHLMSLRAAWGEEAWREWCQAMLANDTLVVDGNSAVVRLVGQGKVAVGFTDSDDIAVGIRNGLPLRQLEIGKGFPAIQNSAVVVPGGPNPENGRALVAFLQRPKTVNQLVSLGALEGADAHELARPMIVWSEVLLGFDDAYQWLESTFFRGGSSL